MKTIRIVFSLMLIFAGWKGHAQTENTSLLWKIEGAGIKTSYLYGTIHLLPQDDFAIKEKVIKAFNSTEQVVLEIDMDDPSMQMKIMKNASMKDGLTLDKLLSEEDYQVVSEEIKSIMGIGLEPFNTFKPFMIYSMLITKLIEGPPASYELTFVKMAQENEMEVLGLELVEDQLAVFDRIPYEEQAKDIIEMVRNQEKTRKEFAALVEAYNKEDIEHMQQVIESYAATAIEMDELINKRNSNWIPIIGKLVKDKSCFIGVGAGHLGGKKGVVNLLKEAGYTISPIN